MLNVFDARTHYCGSPGPFLQFLKAEKKSSLKILGNFIQTKAFPIHAFGKPAPPLVELPDELVDAVTPVARRAHLLEEAHSILGSMTGHREVERAQE